MIDQPFLWGNIQNEDSEKLILVLPEIFGVTQFIKDTVDKLSLKFNCQVYALDFFYPLTGDLTILDYQKDKNKAIKLKSALTAEIYLSLLKQTLSLFRTTYPNITEIIVCGFCFGGKLAFLSGIDSRVAKIISFYGADAHNVFYQNMSTIEILTEKRSASSLKILALYGGQDVRISEEERLQTLEKLDKSEIKYREVIYPRAGHAFMNDYRETFELQSTQQAWEEIEIFLNL
jgi:carboxymethylenebutenolidase